VLIDPYRNRHDRYWFTRRFPDVPCDLALITHAHFDHDAAPDLPETTSVLRMPGEFHYRDVYIRGVLDQHSGTSSKGMPNVMFRLETGGLRFLHIGDNRVNWPDSVRHGVGDIDILMVTVDDSCHLLTYAEVAALIDRLHPRVVIPMHYQIPGLMSDMTTLRSIDNWLATQTHPRRLGGHQICLSPAALPTTPEIWLFEPAPASFAAPRVDG
jgi:L-ascorbate metabolism protein UlaG (beta-lactamase superfamily)